MNQLRTSIVVIALLLLAPLVSANEQNNLPGQTPFSRAQPAPFTPSAPVFHPYPPASPYAYPPARYFPEPFDYEVDPAQIIKDTLNKITDFITHANNVDPVELRSFIEDKIIPRFDFDNMAHWITGPYAQYMSPQEKNDFQRQLRETFLSSLAKHLGSFDAENTRIRFTPAQYRGDDEAFVRTFIYRQQQPPMRLNFRMRRAGDSWKIIDVRANGASAVLYYRQHFMSQLRQYRSNY